MTTAVAAANRARRQARATAWSRWITQLGDLTALELPDRVRQAGELRRDHPDLTHAQLAEQMGFSSRTFERHLMVFLDLVHAPA